MILTCPSCRARYLVQAAIFAQGARQVRCARCKKEWRAEPPLNIDVVAAPPSITPAIAPLAPQSAQGAPQPAAKPARATSPSSPMAAPAAAAAAFAGNITANLPAVIRDFKWRLYLLRAAALCLFAAAFVAWPVLDRQQITEVFPFLRGLYEMVGLPIHDSNGGLIFENVTSELRYDSGMMELYVDGTIHNATSDRQLVPEISATARAPDRRAIKNWTIAPPVAALAPGADAPFHSETPATTSETVEDVYLAFARGGS